jgi:predicted O-linked N-acetylglucosamine transferase (SPINDLY family)
MDETCVRAMRLQLAGDTRTAEQLYRGILELAPEHAAANHCLGMLMVQRREPARAVAHLLAAIQAAPDIADYWLGLLEALLQAGELDQADDTLTLARAHGLSGAAVEEFSARLNPRLRAQQELELMAHVAARRLDAALASALHMTQRFPEHGVAWKVAGVLAFGEQRHEEALRALDTAARLLPGDSEVLLNLGTALLKLNRFAEAEEWLRRALALDPDLAAAHYRLGSVYGFQARMAEALASTRAGLARARIPPTQEDQDSHSNLVNLLSYDPCVDAETLYAEQCRFGASVETPLRGAALPHRHDPDPDRALRVGFVSGDLRNHSVALFLEPVLKCLAGNPRWRLYAYSSNALEDEVTQRLRGYCAGWTAAHELSDERLAAAIVADRIDILIDLAGHTPLNRLTLLAHRPAPVQASWLGYPGSTGMRSVDYYFADAHWLAPEHFARYFSERLVLLPDRWAYEGDASAPPVNELPALASGGLQFASFHRMNKLNTSTLALWSRVLGALPDSRLLIADIFYDGQQAALEREFAAHGVGADRLRFRPRCAFAEYLRCHHEVDLALDAHPYAGGTTTIHSLWMGVPTLTLTGSTSMSRAGRGILGKLDLDAFCADDADAFVAKAVQWNRDRARLAQIRASLRERFRRSPGGQPELIASHLEAAWRHMWRRWCGGLGAESFRTTDLIG